MSNPYEPPSSDIKIDESDSDKRLGWKIFFLFMLALNIFGYYGVFLSIATEGDYSIVDIIGLFIYPFMLLALFGYAFKKSFFKQSVWKIFFPISLITDLVSIFIELSSTGFSINEFSALGDNGVIIIVLVMGIFMLPILLLEYLALYRYGFTDRAPWKKV